MLTHPAKIKKSLGTKVGLTRYFPIIYVKMELIMEEDGRKSNGNHNKIMQESR